ncbi:hypothetical protein AB0N23_16195 [Streptomyces sp. NPDC052644]
MERWRLTWVSRGAMLGEIPAVPRTHETEAATDGLDEQTIVDMLHHIIDEHTDGAGVLTDAERI